MSKAGWQRWPSAHLGERHSIGQEGLKGTGGITVLMGLEAQAPQNTLSESGPPSYAAPEPQYRKPPSQEDNA